MTDEIFARDAEADARAFYLQRAFRAVLDAMARPGEVTEIEPVAQGDPADAAAAGLTPAALVVGDVVLDAATTVAVAGPEGTHAASVIARRTHARPRALAEAAFCFVPEDVRGSAAAEAICVLNPGTLIDPQLGATAIVGCRTLMGLDRAGVRTGAVAGADEASTWELTGPGIKDRALITLDRTDVMDARAARGDEFPCGIDCILVDGAGHLIALPRTTRARRVDGGSAIAEGGLAWAM